MRFDLNEEQQFLAETTRRFLAKELTPGALRTWTRSAAGEAYRQWWQTCSALGWSGIFAPESCTDYGSVSGSPIVDAAIVAELAGDALAPSALLGSSVAVRALARADLADPAVLGGILDGTHIATFAVDEVAGRWSLETIRTTARRDGGDVIVTGDKTNVPDAATADVLLVSCRLEDAVSLVAVPATADGVTRTQRRGLDVLREFGDVSLDQVRVPADAVLTIESEGTALAQEAMHLATCLQLAESVGATHRLAALLLDYSRNRYAFGRPIGGFQALKHRIADVTLWVESCKATVDAAVDAVSKGSADADLLVSVAKSYVGDRSIRIAQECTQMFGGIGLTWEHDAHLYLRRLTANRALLGTPEQHRARIADILRARDTEKGIT